MLWCYRGVACNTSVAFGMCAYFASLVAQTCVCVPRRLGSSGLRGHGFYNLIIGVWHSLVVRLVRVSITTLGVDFSRRAENP